MENLRTWLNGCRDYTSGVLLYDQYGSDPALKRMFLEEETDFKKTRLLRELETIWDNRKPTAVANQTPPADVPKKKKHRIHPLRERLLENEQVIEDLEADKEQLEEEVEDLSHELKQLKRQPGKNGWPVEMDATLTSLKAQWYKAFLEQKDLQSRLYEVAKAGVRNKAKEKEAGTMALRILDLQETIFSFYERRDHYLEHGQLPEPPAPVAECLDPALYSRRYENAMRHARTYRKKLGNIPLEDPRYLAAQQLLQKWESEAALYRSKLKLD